MRSQNAEELPKKATITLRFSSFVSQWGFSHSATSAAELEVRDSTHEYDQRGTGWNNLSSWNRKRPGVTFNSYLESKVCTGTTHRGEVFLFVPVGTEMSVGAAAALSLSAQHGRRLDSNLSGLRYQQTGGGCRGRWWWWEAKVSFRDSFILDFFVFIHPEPVVDYSVLKYNFKVHLLFMLGYILLLHLQR